MGGFIDGEEKIRLWHISPFCWRGNDPATMRGRLHWECCFAPSWPTLPLPNDPTAGGFTPRKSDFEIEIKILEKNCFGSTGCCVTYRDPAHVRRGRGAELILIILLLAGGIIYATLARNPMSFDDLIELRFLPSRRRHRDPTTSSNSSP